MKRKCAIAAMVPMLICACTDNTMSRAESEEMAKQAWSQA